MPILYDALGLTLLIFLTSFQSYFQFTLVCEDVNYCLGNKKYRNRTDLRVDGYRISKPSSRTKDKDSYFFARILSKLS